MVLDIPDPAFFPSNCSSHYPDWYETDEIRSILNYQRHAFDQWKKEITRNYRILRPGIIFSRFPIARFFGKLTPRYERQAS